MPSKYTPELKARAIELVLHAQGDPDTARGAVSRIADELNISRETLRIWVRTHKESGMSAPTESVDLEAENRRLRKELAESQRANEILKKASAFFAAELELPTQVVVDFIDDNRAHYGVEPIIRVLSDTPARIAVSTYYAVKSRPASARSVRDDEVAAALHCIYADNYSCYGARKLWAEINREGTFGHVARCTVERIMGREGLRGIRRRVKKPATRSADADECPDDLVDRDFDVEFPNMLWVADITYIPTRAGWVYAAFVLDAATREFVGWQVTNHLRASLARDALDMALSARLRAGQDVSGLIHHSDRGVQYRSVAYGKSLADSKVVASVGSKGDSYDNAMAEALNSVFKAELIDRRTWPALTDVIVETSKWVGWYNTRRLHSAVGYVPPVQAHRQLLDKQAVAA
ncbi:IS3 family transposase [Corynebacterium variabile]|uniref:Transposase and inactivated derivatives n=7 Tax=Corynebacterium variabile TaxID=1727 RepID=A0A0X2NN13_9CORY|nr:IS3 family transposase [Corynebacterium variabile]CUU66121.1 Transposase and inactivated derivatives [Corynebacterium variabile]